MRSIFRLPIAFSFAVFAAIALIGTTLVPAQAQSESIAELLEGAQQQTAQTRELLQALQTADQITQYALVKSLLKHDDKALVRLGREHALFSTNPVMQNLAINSVFANQPRVRLVISNPDSDAALKWIEYVGGAHDGQIGAVIMDTGKYDGACWLQPVFRSCRFTVVGTSVQFTNSSNGGQSERRAQSVLSLGTDGVLRGTMVSSSGRVILSIDLKE